MVLKYTFVFIVIAAAVVGFFKDKIDRLNTVNSLFHKDNIVRNFRALHNLGFPYVNLTSRGAPIAELSPSDPVSLPSTFFWNGTKFDLQEWLQDRWTTGLVVIKIDSVTKARILHESYGHGNDIQSRCVSWSMCKSFISAMVGIAVDKGVIGDIVEKTVTDYVPELKRTGYDGVTLKNLLQMSSGVAFNENYFNPFSDINVMGYTLALGWSMDSFVATLKRERDQGIFNHYVSIDTQVLAMVLTRAANTSLSDFAEEHLWSKVGFEYSATWVRDNKVNQMELGFGILGVTTRDYARFGWLYHNRGLSPATGDRVLSENWVMASLHPDAPHLMPGEQNLLSDYPTFGYGYQWWLCPQEHNPSLPDRDFMAIGIYGQVIYVSPADGIVIAKNAAFPSYKDHQHPTSHENYVETQGFQALRAISRHLREA